MMMVFEIAVAGSKEYAAWPKNAVANAFACFDTYHTPDQPPWDRASSARLTGSATHPESSSAMRGEGTYGRLTWPIAEK